jgi:hypothetical protein
MNILKHKYFPWMRSFLPVLIYLEISLKVEEFLFGRTNIAEIEEIFDDRSILFNYKQLTWGELLICRLKSLSWVQVFLIISK